MENEKSKEAMTYAILSTSSVWSLIQCRDLKYARVAFGLCIANSSLGLVNHFLPENKRKLVKTLLETSNRIAGPLYMPLITAEACIFSRLIPQDNEIVVGELFVIPCAYLLWTEILRKDLSKDVLRVSVLINTITLVISSKENNFGVATSLINCAAFSVIDLSSTDYVMLLALANLTALIFFKYS